MNIGAPIIAVIAPTGKANPSRTVLANKSQISNIIAPSSEEVGKRNLWSLPISFLHTWGITKPIKPMMPTKETTTAVRSDANKREMNLNIFRLIPKVAAVSSPNSKALYR